jgi:hypothetical protein
MRRTPKARRVAWLAALALVLAACGAAPTGPPLDTLPHRGGMGFAVPVDPVYGTPAPGSRPIF